jgi:tRNA-splicing ligase RtcB (3'-phosphate/5'-hydroxy nucleic acid ligase)
MIRGADLLELGVAHGPVFGLALRAAQTAEPVLGRDTALARLMSALDTPDEHVADAHFGVVAAAIVGARPPVWTERDAPAPFASWCDDAEEGAIAQMQTAMRVPSAVRGALMPDAHQGYGLPIGGVLATEGTVIPYAVGVDIACRMRLTVLDLPADLLDSAPERLDDHGRWTATEKLHALRDRAARQLGSSGSGNHFAEFGSLTLDSDDLGLARGRYLALLSHSGSRGAGAAIANHYSKLAERERPELPRELANLAWLDLEHEAGAEYWTAMELMGDYAAANHQVLHERVLGHLAALPLASVENHHNFAWVERIEGRQLVVHRKGATPAQAGVLGIVPGSMATPGYVVRGRGSSASLDSASHGAGRRMSRGAARRSHTWAAVRPLLEAAGVRLLGAGIDESPLAYKDIETVIDAQRDLITVVARFDPRIVRMADDGERPEH